MPMFDEPPSRPHPHPLAFGQHDNRTPTHGYPATHETAMAAFGKLEYVGVRSFVFYSGCPYDWPPLLDIRFY
jgi:hypothetical protein